MAYNKQTKLTFIGNSTDPKPTGFYPDNIYADGHELIEKDTLDKYIYLDGEWVFLENLGFNAIHNFYFNTENLAWEAGVGITAGTIGDLNVTIPAAQPVSYLTKLDEASDVVSYVGEALPGSADDSAVWRIKKIDTTSGVIITWRDGDTNFNNKWTERISESYS